MIRNVNNIFQSMKQNQHFIIESKNIHLTEEGYQFIEDFLRMESIITTNTDLYTDLKGRYLIFIRDCILAHYRMKNNIDYVIKDNRIFVLNELTGRVELGKNFNYPMNLFLELKEGLPFNINQVITTSVFYQSFFNKFR